MKTARKIFAILLALMLALALSAPAFAATSKITVNDDESATYAGYLLMTSTNDATEEHYSYVVNPTYESAIKQVLELESTATNNVIVATLGAMDADEIRAFADAMYEKVQSVTADKTFNGGEETAVAQGYWLLVETTDVTGEEDKVRSLTILDTAGSSEIEVTPKKGLPTVEKTAEVTTANIGDTVEFTLVGTTDNYNSTYKKYIYEFVDTMTAMDYVDGSAEITVTNGAGATEDDFTVTYNAGTLTITSGDLKGKITENTIITVTYEAKINSSAITTTAKNDVHVNYSNDPYDEDGEPGGSGSGSTPEEEVPIDVFNLVIDKYDASVADKSVKLKDAKFTLQNGAGKYYFWNDTDEIVEWKDSEVVFATNEDGAIEFNGLATGDYTLTETVPPDGYNKLDSSIVFSVSKDEDGVFSDAEGNAVFTSNTGTVDVANASGKELPATGGIGTTLFITFGMLAVLVAGVFLVTNKRMAKESF